MQSTQVLFLLKQLKTCDLAPGASANDPELKERLQFQEVEIERLGVLQERLEQKTSECDTLKKVSSQVISGQFEY